MGFKSYRKLEELEKLLIENGFDSLPLVPSEIDLEPYYKIYEAHKDYFITSIIADLSEVFSSSISLIWENIVFEDIDEQGATHADFKFSLSENGCLFDLKVTSLIFDNRIILMFEHPEILKLNLSKKTSKSLKRFNKIGNYSFNIELKLLA